jgi:hypothetical protein
MTLPPGWLSGADRTLLPVLLLNESEARMDLIDLFWNWNQSNHIAELRSEVDRLKNPSLVAERDPLRADVDALRLANGELRLYVATLFRALELKGIIGREELIKLVEQIDKEDGRQDKALGGDVLP